MDWLEYIGLQISNFTSGVMSVLSYVRSIFQGLWYGLTTLLTGVGDLINDVFTSGIF